MIRHARDIAHSTTSDLAIQHCETAPEQFQAALAAHMLAERRVPKPTAWSERLAARVGAGDFSALHAAAA